MSLEKNEGPDWAAVGLDRVGGDDDRIPDSLEDLKAAKKALEEAYACLNEIPELDAKPFEKIAAKLFILQEKHTQLRRDMWINHLRAFAAGVLVAWIAWTIFGGPS